MQTVNLFAGIAFDPGIRGILVVMVGVAVLMGSVYLILSTNLGNRLGLLVALAGLFGWLTILTLVWWISPPAIGPRGNNASWKPVEIYVNGGTEAARTAALSKLVDPASLPSADKILAANPDLAQEFPNGFTLSELETAHPAIVDEYLTKEQLQGWKLVPSSKAGEAQASADVIIVDSGVFKTTADYKKLNTWEYGGKPTRQDECADSDTWCRVVYRVNKTINFKHPTHYAVVQVQAVIPQKTKAGQAPPIPKADPTQPVISVVMVRDLGDVRLIPFLYFVISAALFIIFAWALHNRDKHLMANKAAAAEAEKAKA